MNSSVFLFVAVIPYGGTDLNDYMSNCVFGKVFGKRPPETDLCMNLVANLEMCVVSAGGSCHLCLARPQNSLGSLLSLPAVPRSHTMWGRSLTPPASILLCVWMAVRVKAHTLDMLPAPPPVKTESNKAVLLKYHAGITVNVNNSIVYQISQV